MSSVAKPLNPTKSLRHEIVFSGGEKVSATVRNVIQLLEELRSSPGIDYDAQKCCMTLSKWIEDDLTGEDNARLKIINLCDFYLQSWSKKSTSLLSTTARIRRFTSDIGKVQAQNWTDKPSTNSKFEHPHYDALLLFFKLDACASESTRLPQLWDEEATNNVNICDHPIKTTPLHHAAFIGSYEVVTFLCSVGADIFNRDILGQTAIDYVSLLLTLNDLYRYYPHLRTESEENCLEQMNECNQRKKLVSKYFSRYIEEKFPAAQKDRSVQLKDAKLPSSKPIKD